MNPLFPGIHLFKYVTVMTPWSESGKFASVKIIHKNNRSELVQFLTPTILATWEAEIQMIVV
jgi:hypothetical protein